MKTPTTLKLTVAVVAMASAGSFLFAPAAHAAKVKECGTTVVQTGPGNSGMTQTETETQTAACGSNSDQGEDIQEGPVTNRGGGTPGGRQ